MVQRIPFLIRHEARSGGGIPASSNALNSPTWDAGRVINRCLIVDDSPSFLEAARVLLEREGLEVVGVASTGAEALEQAATSQPDVVLVDVMLGEESGLDVARRLAEDALGDEAVVVLISTHGEDDVADLIGGSGIALLPKSELSAGAIRELAAWAHDEDG
jgi:DNA-binding NarL/FixJ family response regulator